MAVLGAGRQATVHCPPELETDALGEATAGVLLGYLAEQVLVVLLQADFVRAHAHIVRRVHEWVALNQKQICFTQIDYYFSKLKKKCT